VEKSEITGNLANLEVIDGDPSVGWEALQHGHEELETAVPVTQQQHHTDEVEDTHEHPGYAQKLSTYTRSRAQQNERHQKVLWRHRLARLTQPERPRSRPHCPKARSLQSPSRCRTGCYLFTVSN